MKRKYFTEQEIAILAQNPYTDRVSTSNIKFTPAFKLLFWQEYCSGTQPTAIFRKCNYDPEILGHNRIGRLQHAVKESALAGEPLYAGVRTGSLPSPLFSANDHLLKQLQKLTEEVEYLRQENAFLKKNGILAQYKTAGGGIMKETSAIYECIRSTLGKNGVFSVSHLCQISGVSRSGYYAWLKTEPARDMREQQDRKNFELIAAAFGQRGYSKGAKGIYMCLLHFKPPVVMNLKKIRRLMKKYGLVCKIRSPNAYRQMIRQIHEGKCAPNLVKREFRKYGPRKILLTDITYLPYNNSTFVYLCTILDAFTKQILSYTLSQNLKEDFVLETVEKLVRTHGISLTEETIIHSDQGIHFTSVKFIDIVEKAHLRQSMSRRGNCWDNAPQESFFGHMKDHIGERIKKSTEYGEAQKLVDDYIDYYNKERYQWDLAKLSPDEYYKFCTTKIYPLKWINTDTAEQIAETLAVCG